MGSMGLEKTKLKIKDNENMVRETKRKRLEKDRCSKLRVTNIAVPESTTIR
jgi:hypothetical protein